MYNATTKKLTAAILCALFLSAFSFSCNSKKADDSEAAEHLMSEIKSLYSSKDYDKALLAIDSLMKTYPGQTDIQRQALHVQTQITEKKALADSIANEQVYASCAAAADSIKQSLKFVNSKEMVEGYYVDKSAPSDGMPTTTRIIPRVSADGEISVLSSLRGHSIRHTKLVIATDSATVETVAVPLSNSRNYRYKDNGKPVELVTFNQQECDSLCKYIASASAPVSVTLVGQSGKQKIALTVADKTSFSNIVAYSEALTKMQEASMNRLKFAKRLNLARKQIKQTATNIQGDRK